MNEQASIRIGTRRSPLALWQANEVRRRLIAAHDDLNESNVQLVKITTTGDMRRDVELKDVGGKGAFTKEIVAQLRSGGIDLAVHSMKDVPTVLEDGMEICCLLPREDPRDAFLSNQAASIDDLPIGAVVGSSSLRRKAQLTFRRPDLKVVKYRGNVDTRINNLDKGVVSATFLATAGLKRLRKTDRVTAHVEPEVMLPAVAQGAVGVEIKADNDAIRGRLAPLHDLETDYAVTAERAFLRALDGSCNTPIAALALRQEDGSLWLRGEIVMPDGSDRKAIERRGPVDDAWAMGNEAGEELKRLAGPEFFSHLR